MSYRYPVFTTHQPASGTAIPVSVSLDPVAPLDATRTFLGLVPANASAGPELGSYFQTPNRLAVRLTPLPTPAAKLVPAVRALSNPPSPFDPFYLVPLGAFRIQVVDENGNPLIPPQRLMCGTSGIEWIDLPDASCELWFSPGGPALAAGQGLDGTASTAYASVFAAGGSGGLTYRAQPDGSALFSTTGTANFLSFNELPGATLLPAPSDGSLPTGFPMAPYPGIVDSDLTPYQELEYKAIAPTRRTAITNATKAAASLGEDRAQPGVGSGTTAPTVTPQGLLADVNTDTGIVNLSLIVSTDTLELQQISPALKSALQANQLFLVASDPSGLLTSTSPTVNGTVTIPGQEPWVIDAWPTAWAATGTLLVMKFAGKSLSDLAGDTTTWAQAPDFNGGTLAGVSVAQQTLLASIEEAVKRAPTDPEFAPFAQLAADPSWQGLLILNAPVPVSQLPTDLAGLAAGIDASQFKAHHVGLTVTPVNAGSGTPQQQASSLFGLIFYESASSAAGAQGPYSFNVLTLKVRFANSAVATFSSQIQLLIDQLFGEPATRTDTGTKKPCTDNVLVLYGVYQQQGATSGYTFSTDQDNLYVMASGVLSSVEVTGAQFVTVALPAGGQPRPFAVRAHGCAAVPAPDDPRRL